MKDYYAILGLDADASQDTIKLAYRRLALQAHPDRLSHLSPARQAEASSRMADLNEAYTQLSDQARRKVYDAELARFQSDGPAPVVVTPQPAAPAQSAAAAAQPQAAAAPRTRARPDAEMQSSVIGQFSAKLRQGLLGAAWKEDQLEGFAWAARSGSWPRYLVTAFRGFVTLDSDQTRKFLNYADLAVARSKRLVGGDTLIFVLAFQAMSERDGLTKLSGRFARLTNNRAALVMVDAVHGRSLVAGRKGDPRIEAALKQMGFR